MPMADAYRSRGSATNRMIVLTIPTKARRNAKVSHAHRIIRQIIYITAMTSTWSVRSSANLRNSLTRQIHIRTETQTSFYIANISAA